MKRLKPQPKQKKQWWIKRRARREMDRLHVWALVWREAQIASAEKQS